jgi:hypothetical protein
VAVFISIFIGISTNFYLAAGCYLLAALCVVAIVRRHTLASPIEASEDAPAAQLSSVTP